MAKHGVVLVGEALGEDEANQSGPLHLRRPFVGKAGAFLDRLIERQTDPLTKTPLKRDDFLVTNVLRCRPPDNKITKQSYEFDAIRNCSPYLVELLNQIKPKVIVPLGNQPLRWFTGMWGIEKRRGYIYKSPYGLVIPTYHPSYLIRGNFHLSRIWQHDLMKALAVARNGPPKLAKYYDCDPPAAVLENFIRAYERAGYPPLAFDIETPYSERIEKDGDIEAGMDDEEEIIENDPSYNILRISFAFNPQSAISVPWQEPYISLSKRLLALRGWKLVWNQHFDVPRLLHAGVHFGGPVVDGMDVWHFMESSWPAGLKFAATFSCPDMHYWKDDSKSNPAWYNAADSDVLLRTFLYSKRNLEREGRWEVFYKQYIRLRVILFKMSERGILTDPIIRKEGREYFKRLFDKFVLKLQGLVPIGCRKLKVFRAIEEKLRATGKWEEGKMVQVEVEVPVALKTWYVLNGTREILGKVKARGMENAQDLAAALQLEGACLLTSEKPPKVKKARKTKAAIGAEVPEPPTPTST